MVSVLTEEWSHKWLGDGSAAVSAVGVVLKNPPRLVRQDRLREKKKESAAKKHGRHSCLRFVRMWLKQERETSTKQIIL